MKPFFILISIHSLIQKLRLLIFGYLDIISEETNRFIDLRFKASSSDKFEYK